MRRGRALRYRLPRFKPTLTLACRGGAGLEVETELQHGRNAVDAAKEVRCLSMRRTLWCRVDGLLLGHVNPKPYAMVLSWPLGGQAGVRHVVCSSLEDLRKHVPQGDPGT